MQKQEAVSSICSGKIFDLKILESDWLRAFWPISLEQDFSQIQVLCRSTANNINFHYRTNSVKINVQIFLIIEKTLFLAYFWPISPIFGTKKVFLKNSALPHITL